MMENKIDENSLPNNQQQQSNQNLPNQQQQQPLRTLFPGGYKRPEIKVPSIVLQLDSEDVIRGGSEASDLIDKAVSKSVGIVVLNGCSDGGGGSGKSLYEAACLVKSVVRDRAYLLIGERVDIAAAVNSRGVVLSDQGLPSITPNAALNASNSEVVLVSLEDLKLFSDDGLTHMFDNACATDKKSQDELKNSSKLKSLDMENDIHEKTTVAGFVKLEDREKQLIEKERSLLLEAIDAMQKATSLQIVVSGIYIG
ncbi:hypothetical protein OIU76_006892 [Salix suchowensis]|nr:hypothetical protein OIU76_006892 [Salix suchowensis]